MPGHSAPGSASPGSSPGQRWLGRILAYPAQVTLNALMSLAAMAFERRIRKALRSKAGPARRTGQVEADMGSDSGPGFGTSFS